MGEGQKNVPKLRFKGYEDAWEQRKLGSDINVTSVKRVHQSDWETEGVPFYRARDIVSEFKGEEISEPIFVSKKTYEEFSRISGKVQADDLLVTGVGTIGVPYLVKSNNPLYFKDGNVIWIQNNKKLDGYFLFYTFITNPIQNFIRESAGTGTVGTLTIETCKRIPVFIPGKREQIAVGEFFQSLDNLITLHQRKYDALKSMKKTLLSKMFPKNGEDVPEIRFKEFTDAWEQRKVSEITKFHKQGYYTTEEYNDNKKYYLLRGTDLTGNKLVLKDTPKIDATEKDYDAFKTEIGDFLIVRSGNVGTYGIVDVDIPAIFGSYLIDFRFDTEKVTNEFFGYFYQSERFQSQLNKITQSSANINVNAENIKSTYISLPVLIEQKKISNIMIALDNCITLHQRKLEELKNMKKTLLQQMFV